ncbi:uncharacterized protein LOC100378923 [Saccoglossus kowalevskii]|uniref:Uncharacterized protein C7orf31-like n=1 Tax=Saccoglossus kowalevskii TaxID=10224 RepID=A0ABM0MKP2_SACKO|nr:PREDICTED: uncharacterized protein C7orf31-like [Saccoglossus kowalevskii]
MAATDSLSLSHFYRDTTGLDSLSRNYQSSELFTPYSLPQRPTVSELRYLHYRNALERVPRLPWGTHREYGGIQSVNLPDDHRPKSEPPAVVEKGHRHFGTGADPFPRGVPVNQYYDLTSLKRSNIRSNDELVPRPESIDMTKLKINLPFPAEHPYASHQPKFALFPTYGSNPDDPNTGTAAQYIQPLHHSQPAAPYDVKVEEKVKGHALRRESQVIPPESHKKALSWPGDNFYQLARSTSGGRQQYYPTPPKMVLPNHNARSLDNTLSPQSANTLRNVERSQWVTTYQNNFTGFGPANALQLDNYADKKTTELVYGVEDTTLRPRSYNTFLPPRPLEGRISRMIGPATAVRCVIKDGRIEYVPFTPKVDIEMDKVREHPNLPSETHDSFQDPKTQQWKKLENEQTSSTALKKLEEKKEETPQLFVPEKEKEMSMDDWKKELEEWQKNRFEDITLNTRWKQAEKQQHHDDLSLLRRKVSHQMPIMQPPVYYDTLHKVHTCRAPFYYDGTNPYELDDVTPWEYHLTKSHLELKEQDEEAVKKHAEKSPATQVSEKDWDKYQFAGSTGQNPSLKEPKKYSNFQLLHGRPRLENSFTQKPPGQSVYTYDYNPDLVKTVTTATKDKYDLRDLHSSIPKPFRSLSPIQKNGMKSVQISDTVKVASGGNGQPLSVITRPASVPNLKEYRGNVSFAPQTDKHWFPDLNRSVDLDYLPRETGQTTHPSLQYSPPDWAEQGTPRPQSKLIPLQNSFTRTDAHRKFHSTFQENNPDLRENITEGMKHDFQGENAYHWH